MDILWHCLVEDAECYDDALHWFLNQVRSKDQHAMGMETYKHLFLEKVGTKKKKSGTKLYPGSFPCRFTVLYLEYALLL